MSGSRRSRDRAEAQLADGREFLLGDRFSAADYLLTMLTRWSRNMAKPATVWPRLCAYIARMKARAGLIEVHAREGLTEWDRPALLSASSRSGRGRRRRWSG